MGRTEASGGPDWSPKARAASADLPRFPPAEASQQMAELSEVLALRMETHDQQRREVTQLRTQVLTLQRCCQTVRPSKCVQGSLLWSRPHGPRAPPSLPSPQGALGWATPRPLCAVEAERRSQRAPVLPPRCPREGTQAQRGSWSVLGRLMPCDLLLQELPEAQPWAWEDLPVVVGRPRLGLTSLGSRSFQYGAETEKLQQQLASEKEIQIRLQDEVKPPLAPARERAWRRARNSRPSLSWLTWEGELLEQALGLSLCTALVSGLGPGRWQFIWGLSGVESRDLPGGTLHVIMWVESLGRVPLSPGFPAQGRGWARCAGRVCLGPHRTCRWLPSCRTCGRSSQSVGAS